MYPANRRIAASLKRAVSSKPVKYKAKPKPQQSRLPKGQKPTLKWPAKPKKRMKQYGDKGYRPSSGRGVGY